MRAENWIIPEDDDDWQAAREDLNAALATPFTSKSRESPSRIMPVSKWRTGSQAVRLLRPD